MIEAEESPTERQPRARRGVQSVGTGTALLRVLADSDTALPLGELAARADMSAAKAHRYLISYVREKLVVQSERSGVYDLGPLAVRIGLVALQRFDLVRIAGERLTELRNAVDATTLLSVWTDEGPTVARIELSRHPVTLAVRVGTTFPMATTATGRIFMAFAPELRSARTNEERLAFGPQQWDAIASAVSRDGTAAVDQTFLVGVQGVAAPLINADGRLAAALTVIGAPSRFSLAPDGPVAIELRRFAAQLSSDAHA